MEKKQFSLFMFFLGFILLFNIVYGDTNGIWHYAEDVVPGTFGSDEQTVGSSIFTFINKVIFNESTKFSNIANFSDNVYYKDIELDNRFINFNGDYMTGTLYINANAGRGLYSYSSINDGIAGITSASGKSAIYGWAKNSNAYSGYFEGGNFIIASGNVGIGTRHLNHKLEINGSSYVSGDFFVGKNVYIDENAFVTDLYVRDKVFIDGSLYTSENGLFDNKVGIGTRYPNQKLDVRGNAYISGKLRVPTIEVDDLIVNNGITFPGGVVVGGTTGGGGSSVSGDDDPTNEFQTLSISGNRLTISHGNTIILPTSSSTGDADSDPTNELQNLDSVLSRGNSAGGKRINNIASADSNDDAPNWGQVKNYVDSKINTNTPRLSCYRTWTDCSNGYVKTGEDSGSSIVGDANICCKIIY